MTYWPETVYQVTAPHFVAGFVCDENGKVVDRAPILYWATSLLQVKRICKDRDWLVERVP